MTLFYRILGFSAILFLIAAQGSYAEPYMAVQTGKQCSACHVNVNGQGMRTSFGVQYAEEFLGIKDTASPLLRKASQELSIGVDFRLQNFTSLRRDEIQNIDGLGETSVVTPPREMTANAFLLEQANLYANLTLVQDRVNFYVSEEIGQTPRNRELAGIISFPEHSAYLKVGKMYMPYGLRVWDKDSFILSKTGVLESDYGFEMGVEKGRFDNSEIEEVVKKVRDIGFYVGANYIFGLPDDDRDSMKKTLDLSIRINSEWANFYSAMAYPGSQLYTLAKKNNWPLPDDKNGPGWIGYSQHAYETLPLPTEKLKASEVLDFRDKAFDVYFKNNNYLNLIKSTFGNETKKHIETQLKTIKHQQ